MEQSQFISKEDVIANFPFKFRGNQESAINQIVDALNNPEIKYVVVQAPTGAGKSPIGISIAKSAGKAHILTANKMLQDQYMRDFSQDIDDLRGRANYQCRTYPGFTCAAAPCRKDASGRAKCFKEKACEYHDAVEDAKEGDISSMNFAAGIVFMNYTPYFTARDLLIIDEAHLIPDNLTNFIEFSVSARSLDRVLPYGSGSAAQIPAFNESKEYLPWLRQIYSLTKEREKNFEAPSAVDKMTGSTVTLEEIESFNRKLEKITYEITNHDGNLVVDHSFVDMKMTIVDSLSFKPVDVSRYAQENLFQFGTKTLLMSATIINYEEFARSLGLESKESIFIDIPSTFPKENRPIIRNYVGQLNKDTMDSLMPLIVKNIREILDSHSNEKGIIHTHTYKIAKHLMEELRADYGNRLLFPENSSKQAYILAEHSSTKRPTVLISPSMTEGVDLKDDLSRFQIIVKVPYPYMGDKVVQARMKKSPGWYGYKTLLTLIQAYGRSTRSETDESVTYVLDGAFDGLISRFRKTLPKWFTEAIL